MGVSEVEILPPGTVVGDTYEIVREIATGGMGTVYEARNVRLSASRVAVKVLSKLTTRSAELLPRFRREAEIGASLNHPNIIRVMDWNTLPDGLPFFVMEYLEGESLASYMTRNLPK
ncbi:MAG: protein kinase, partial [Myxococcota bacterium]